MDLTLMQALEIMEQCGKNGMALPFSICFDTFDQKTNSTSGRVTYDKAETVMPNRSFTRNFTSLTSQDYIKRKNPNHYDNLTRNIRICDTDQIRKVHIHCIVSLNGNQVKWHGR